MRDSVREFLGVYAPLIVGILLILVAVNFLITPPNPAASPLFALDPVAADACGGMVILVGAILLFSTLGRWRKVRRARAVDRRQKNV